MYVVWPKGRFSMAMLRFSDIDVNFCHRVIYTNLILQHLVGANLSN